MPLAAPPDASLRRRLATLAVGILCVGWGVALTIHAEVGVAPYDVLTTGLAARTGLPLGAAAMLLPAAFTLAGRLLGGQAGIGTLLAILCVGPVLGLAVAVVPEPSLLAWRIAYFAVGFAVIAVGVTAVIIARLGPGPAELVMLALHQRGHPLAPARTAVEVGCVAVGWALGGQVGAGTVVVALLIGPVLRRLLDWSGYEAAAVGVVAERAAPSA